MLGLTAASAVSSTGFTLNTSQLECSDLIHNSTLWNDSPELRCLLVNATESCFFNDGHIEYIFGMYCAFQSVVPLGVTLMFLWLIMMLIGLATTADAFFGPCLIVMADTMHLSQNVAGVTLLALGNGAPDIFSAISSITTLKDGDAGLAFGALLGAGMFVTSVTAGAIAIVKPFTAMSRPLLKDIVFYMFTIFWAFIIMFKQQITLIDSIGFIVLYVLYVLMTVVSRMLYSRGVGSGSKPKQQPVGEQGEQPQDGDVESAGSDRHSAEYAMPMETIRRLRTDTDIRTNLTDVYADNLGFASPVEPAPAAEPRHDSQQRRSDVEPRYDTHQRMSDAEPRYDTHQRRSDAEAGYDTSLDFPGGLRRVGDGEASGGEASSPEVKKPRSRRFQELNIHSSPKSSVTRKPSSRRTSHLDEHMKRVSRTQKISRAHSHVGSPKLSVAGADENIVSGGRKRSEVRKISTTSFTGVERRANYLTRWMLVYGNLENVEHRSRAPSQSSAHGVVVSDADGGGASGGGGGTVSGAVGARGSRSRSSSTTRSPSGSFRAQQLQVLRDRERKSSDTSSVGGGGYKLSGGLSMDGASAYFQRKEQEQQSRKQQQKMEKALQKRLQDEQQQQEEEDIHMRHLYRIESVDEALDDATVDHLNRVNQQRMADAKQREKLEALKEQEQRERERREQRERPPPQQQAEGSQKPVEEKGEGEGEEKAESDTAENQSPIKEFLYSLVPVDIEEFPEMTWYNKVYEIIKAPILFLLLLSTPCVDYDQPLNGWSRILNSVHCAVAPVFIAIAFKGYQWAIPMANGGFFPVVPIVLIVGLLLGILVYCTSSDFEPPRYHAAFAFIGFVTAIVWIYTFANEVVNMLETVGVIFRISSTILGLTVLAWANSIGDVISNTVLARQNFPRVAISACFGGPLFNLLLGVGIPFTIKLLGTESRVMDIQVTVVQLVLVVSVTISLIMSMVYLTVFRYKVGRVYGAMLVVLYLAFLVIALLAETGQLPTLRP